MLAGGNNGTILAYDNGAWAQITPTPAITSVNWSTAFQVRSVYLDGSEGWASGVYNSGNGCTDWFMLRGHYTTKWVWDKLIVTSADLHICPQNGNIFGLAINGPQKVWYDPTGKSLYMVGATMTDANGLPASGGVQGRPEAVRVLLP